MHHFLALSFGLRIFSLNHSCSHHTETRKWTIEDCEGEPQTASSLTYTQHAQHSLSQLHFILLWIRKIRSRALQFLYLLHVVDKFRSHIWRIKDLKREAKHAPWLEKKRDRGSSYIAWLELKYKTTALQSCEDIHRWRTCWVLQCRRRHCSPSLLFQSKPEPRFGSLWPLRYLSQQ